MDAAMTTGALAGILPDERLVYAGFALLAALLFWRLPVRVAILLTVLGGWVLLPVGVYPEASYDTIFPFWIIGIALPSDMLLTKAWVIPAVALVGAGLRDPRALGRLRPHPLDLPVALWCLWPLLVAAQWSAPDPAPLVAAAYLGGSWGALWLLGRAWFADTEGRVAVMQGLALAGAACLPIAWVEMQGLGSLYELLYREHPYGQEGRLRSLFYRPVGAFEHGNQYGIWTSLCALAAVWVAATREGAGQRALWWAVALVALGVGILHESRGGVILLLAGLILLALWRLRLSTVLLGVALLAALGFFALHYSGAALGWLTASGWVPEDALRRGSAGARQLRDVLDGLGIGTFVYRLWTDYQTLDLVLEAPSIGHGQWDWWRPADMRPWAFPLLAAGQFGIIAAGLAVATLLLAPLWCLLRMGRAPVWHDETVGIALSLLVLLALVDATQNSFLFFPAILAAGALVGRHEAPPAPALRP